MTALITFLWFLAGHPQCLQPEPLARWNKPDETTELILRKYQVVFREWVKLEPRPTSEACALLSVVMPEYLSFSPMTGTAELMYMAVTFRADPRRFGRTSFGPFQMQPDFIIHQLRQSTRFSDSKLFEQARLRGNEWIAVHLEEFSRMDVQLRILLMFEENFRHRYPEGSYEEMATLYNTGFVHPSPRIFTKLHQADRSYLDWVRYIRSVVNC